jgi:hypothetical protein
LLHLLEQFLAAVCINCMAHLNRNFF